LLRLRQQHCCAHAGQTLHVSNVGTCYTKSLLMYQERRMHSRWVPQNQTREADFAHLLVPIGLPLVWWACSSHLWSSRLESVRPLTHGNTEMKYGRMWRSATQSTLGSAGLMCRGPNRPRDPPSQPRARIPIQPAQEFGSDQSEMPRAHKKQANSQIAIDNDGSKRKPEIHGFPWVFFLVTIFSE
jgi:hypothetical protein